MTDSLQSRQGIATLCYTHARTHAHPHARKHAQLIGGWRLLGHTASCFVDLPHARASWCVFACAMMHLAMFTGLCAVMCMLLSRWCLFAFRVLLVWWFTMPWSWLCLQFFVLVLFYVLILIMLLLWPYLCCVCICVVFVFVLCLCLCCVYAFFCVAVMYRSPDLHRARPSQKRPLSPSEVLQQLCTIVIVPTQCYSQHVSHNGSSSYGLSSYCPSR